jgi:sec-independent protein translocase protein TatA
MGGLGLPELIIIGVIVLLMFGGKKLPELGAGLGKSIKEFKQAFKSDEPPKDSKESKS